MGLRGPGGGAQRRAKEALASKKPRRHPWKRKGLSRVEAVVAFLEDLPITKGKLTGRKLSLLPGQRAFIEEIYGRTHEDRVRLGIFSEPRGNGKTGLVTGLMLCHLLGPEAEPRGECYSAGIDRLQAALIFHEMEAVIQAVPEFVVRVNVRRFHKQIEVLEGDGIGSKYEALSADARRAHGIAPSFWAYDELAQARDRVLLDNLQTAMGKRNRSLGIVISTQAANDDHPLSELIDDAIASADRSTVLRLVAAPDDADPFDRDVIRSVNPALGFFLDADDVFVEAERARRMSSAESAFRNLRLNQRCASQHDSLVPPADWAKGVAPIDLALFTDGRPVYAGLDLSARLDLTALVLGTESDDGIMHLLPIAWTPEKTIETRTQRDRFQYDAVVRSGFLRTTPGIAIDYEFVLRDIVQAVEGMNLVAVKYDAWKINELKREMSRAGVVLPLEQFIQGMKSFAPAVDAFAVACAQGRIRHGNHPVLRWCVGNTMVLRDAADNRKPDKRNYYGRIDLAVAAIMAVGAMKVTAEAPLEIAAMIA